MQEAVDRVMKALQSKVGSYTTAAENKSKGTNTTYFLLDEVGARMGRVGKHILSFQPFTYLLAA